MTTKSPKSVVMLTNSGVECLSSGGANIDDSRNDVNEANTDTDMFALTEEDVKIQYRNKLGEGTFCNVYPVHIRNRKTRLFNEELPPFALKELNTDILSHTNPNVTKAAYEDLAHEARIMKDLQHHHILPILGMSKQCDTIARENFFIIVEKLESTLDSKLDEWAKTIGYFRKVTSKEPVMKRINEVALAIGQALQYIHSRNFIFRDLKPSNIGFDQSGSVKIFDFGLAVRVPTSGKGVKAKVGTLRYMAPETRMGEYYSYPVDVYAYAILLWQIVTARVPFEEDIPMSMSTPTEDFSKDKRPDLKYVESDKLKELLESSWKTSPKERLTMDDMVLEVQQIGIQMRLACEAKKKKKKKSSSKKLDLDEFVPEIQERLDSFMNQTESILTSLAGDLACNDLCTTSHTE